MDAASRRDARGRQAAAQTSRVRPTRMCSATPAHPATLSTAGPGLTHQDGRRPRQQALFNAAAGTQVQRPQVVAGNACTGQRESALRACSILGAHHSGATACAPSPRVPHAPRTYQLHISIVHSGPREIQGDQVLPAAHERAEPAQQLAARKAACGGVAGVAAQGVWLPCCKAC